MPLFPVIINQVKAARLSRKLQLETFDRQAQRVRIIPGLLKPFQPWHWLRLKY